MKKQVASLFARPGDLAVLIFFLVNVTVITYVVDLEQLVIPDPAHFTYPLWPPPGAIDAIHWWGYTFDPVLIARPAWWKMTIWIDALFFGPFYVFAIYAFLKQKEWIRMPSVIYASTMLTNVTIILGEEMFGAHASPQLPVVLLANLPWVLYPLYILYRVTRASELFNHGGIVSDAHSADPISEKLSNATGG